MYPAALHQISTQTVDSSEVFEKIILQKQPQIISKIKINGTKAQLMIWNKFVPNRTMIFSGGFCRQRQFYLEDVYLPDQLCVLTTQFPNIESWKKKDWIILKDIKS